MNEIREIGKSEEYGHRHDCGCHGECAHSPAPVPAASAIPRSDGLPREAIPEGVSTEEAIVPRNPPEIHYSLELYYERLPPWSIATVGTLLRRHDPSVRIDGRSTPTTFLFEYPDRRISPREKNDHGGTTSICCLARSAAPPDPQRLWEPLRQTWGWAGAGEALARCRGSVLITDLVPPNGTIDPVERIRLIQGVLGTILDATDVGMPAPLAIHWVPAGHFVSPEEFLPTYRSSNGFVGIPGSINVRVLPEDLVNEPSTAMNEKTGTPRTEEPRTGTTSSDTPRVRLDTLGLAALGFADFQVDATGLPVSEVVRVLYNTSLYVLERGAVIRDGHTIPGITPDQKWPCRVDVSWMTPRRTVLTIEPIR
ncbi:MAG: DUF4261 domain-containing protein [Planctomycetia bacterium]|nr:DUF4261 domain-containing protein [Planctomycetia bacterium]